MFQDSKRINTRSTMKTTTVKDTSDKYFKPQSPGAVITKDLKTNGDEMVNTYHYYYPEESNSAEQLQQSGFDFAPSTSTTKAPRNKFSSKRKIPSVHVSTDAYQYQPVLPRPSEYTPTDNSHHDFLQSYQPYETKNYASHSTMSLPSASPIKMLKPTKKNNFYLPSSTMSPSSTVRPKMRRPSTESPYDDIKQFSVSPSPSTMPHFSTTRSPETYKYSTPSPVSSTIHGDFYIKASTQVTPSATPSTGDLRSDGTDDQTVVIRPKPQYQNYDNYEPYEPAKETIIYKFVPEVTYYDPNKTEPSLFQSTRDPLPDPEFYKTLNQSTHSDMDFYKHFNKNYKYEYFTEQDAGPMHDDIVDDTMKMDQVDDRQKASKKNMMFSIDPEMNQYMPSSMMPMHIDDREQPPPEFDHDAEASKNNQYFVLYSDDEDEEKRPRKPKRKPKQEPEVVYHHHHHQHEDKDEEYQHFNNEFGAEFDSEVTNSDNVRIVDPGVRGGRPIEFTKDDYLRHIKQAVVQYMKDYQPKENTQKVKSQRFQDSAQDIPHRPTKNPSAASTPSPYRHNLPSQQYKPMAPMKLPKGTYTANRLKDAIEELQESPQVDLTVKKSKQKPFDLSAIDVGQSYQHVSHFDHSAALKNVEEFDQSNVVQHQPNNNKQKLHFSQQTYHDINNLGFNQKQKMQGDDSDGDAPAQNLYKGYMLPNKYKANQGGSSFSSMNYDGSKLPRIVSQHGDDDDEDDIKVDDPVDAPIQIINGIPVANPYNIDLNTLK